MFQSQVVAVLCNLTIRHVLDMWKCGSFSDLFTYPPEDFFFFLTHLPIVGEVLHRDPPRVRDVIEYIPEEKHRAAAYL